MDWVTAARLIVQTVASEKNRKGIGQIIVICIGILAMLASLLFLIVVAFISMLLGGSDYYYPLPDHVYVSSPFGARTDPVTGQEGKFHYGIDYPAPAGTVIHAVQSGIVMAAGDSHGDAGIRVMILHDDGNSSHYFHCSAVLVGFGDYVMAGQPIALVGSTGKSTGNHLHLEIRINMVSAVDPALMLHDWPEEMRTIWLDGQAA